MAIAMNKVGARRSVVDYVRTTETRNRRIVYVYALVLECDHRVTKKSIEPGVPQYAYCGECKKTPPKRTRSGLSSRFA